MAATSMKSFEQMDGQFDDDSTKDDIENQMSAQNIESSQPALLPSASISSDVQNEHSAGGFFGWLYSLMQKPHYSKPDSSSVDCLPVCTGIIGTAGRDHPDFDLVGCTSSADEDIPEVLEIVTTAGVEMLAFSESNCSELTDSTYSHSSRKHIRSLLKSTDADRMRLFEILSSTSKEVQTQEAVPKTSQTLTAAHPYSFDESIRVEDATDVASNDEVHQCVHVNIRSKVVSTPQEKRVESNDISSEQLRLRSLATTWRKQVSKGTVKGSSAIKRDKIIQQNNSLGDQTNKVDGAATIAKYLSDDSDKISVSKGMTAKSDQHEKRGIASFDNGEMQEIASFDSIQNNTKANEIGVDQANEGDLPGDQKDEPKTMTVSRSKNGRRRSKSSSLHRKTKDDKWNVPTYVPMKVYQSDDSVSEFDSDTESIVSAWKRSLVKARKSEKTSKQKNKSDDRRQSSSYEDRRDDHPKEEDGSVKSIGDERDVLDDRDMAARVRGTEHCIVSKSIDTFLPIEELLIEHSS
jgi:hypothetical protein